MRLTEEEVEDQLSAVASFANNAEKLAWRRKLKKMHGLLEDLTPYEEKILKLYSEKQPLMDKIEKLRHSMGEECIHPKEYLAHRGTHIECKFCNKLIQPVMKNHVKKK